MSDGIDREDEEFEKSRLKAVKWVKEYYKTDAYKKLVENSKRLYKTRPVLNAATGRTRSWRFWYFYGARRLENGPVASWIKARIKFSRTRELVLGEY